MRHTAEYLRKHEFTFFCKKVGFFVIVFADECRRGLQHSSEHFDSVLDDITFYRQYCEDHPKFRNEKAAHSIKYIDDIYDKTKRDNAFI